ncbi:unnamed protein product [Rotaria sordida]|uniref:Uncharacterized protein n=2 Tax=Rotaria sordida TaxID=392033 RepID=A0A815U5N6_9BILA|nr:unnamed protein product [Rotaria sordida]
MDVLYSLLDIDNQRLDTILQENIFTNTLNFVLTTLTDNIYSITDPILNQFCINILPKIHNNVKSLILDSISMEKILLAGDYPNLTQVKIFNFNEKILSRYFTDQSPFRRIFQEQITDLILIFEKNINKILEEFNTINLYTYVFNFFINLKYLSITGLFPYPFPHLNCRQLPITICLCSTLYKLSLDVPSLVDCYALLDGRLKQLTILILNIAMLNCRISNIYNMDDLPNLKCFSLKGFNCFIDSYDNKILPLLRRMLNLEELTLYFTVANRTTFIDGTSIYNEILVYMPRLNKFNFGICTDIIIINNLIHRLSKDDIQQTFTNIIFQQVECIVTYSCRRGKCYVFSLPFMFNDLDYIGNRFPTIIFTYVRSLKLEDEVPFEHEFFIRIAWSFPLLEKLSIMNLKRQSSIAKKLNCDDNQLYSIVKFPYLTSIFFCDVHNDYVEQFLNDTKTHLPCLTKLTIVCNQLQLVTENFTRDRTRLNCINVKQLLNLGEPIVHSEDFYVYFPLLKPSVFSE